MRRVAPAAGGPQGRGGNTFCVACLPKNRSPMKKTAEREDLIQMLVHDEARRQNDDLDRRCDQHSRDLYLAQAEIESLGYSLSHDLRAPLIHIVGFVDLLTKHVRTALDVKSRHYLDTIATSAARMGSMIEALASLARASPDELRTVSLDLEVLVNSLVAELQGKTTDRNIAWSTGALPMVDADPTLLREVLKELLLNAIKFTRPRGEAQISITARRSDNDTIVSVRDNGVGFDMKHRDKLFTIFQRLHSNADFEGLGVGLANVRKAIQRHHGRAWADGVPGVGAAFHFSLPDDGTGHI
jgi:light-regulated signal transduction histidine kinase (bacteriophytochrome)